MEMTNKVLEILTAIIIALLLISAVIGCSKENENCGDNYDRCCEQCWEYYEQTGLSTECYGNCWDTYAECMDDEPDFLGGCFIEEIK